MNQSTSELPYCVYILFSEKDHLLYIGFTTNLENRINNHNQGRTKSTSYRRPLHLIFTEYYLFKEDALKREKYFKTTAGKRAIKLMLSNTLEKLNYKKPNRRIEFLFEETEAER
ncbi:MAG: GIY-YIG nuclease family protein [Crocinitomicaceae bacterium]|nr:GIY-YIG nuclease family protein [Crocinitomicaceae bacterium]